MTTVQFFLPAVGLAHGQRGASGGYSAPSNDQRGAAGVSLIKSLFLSLRPLIKAYSMNRPKLIEFSTLGVATHVP